MKYIMLPVCFLLSLVTAAQKKEGKVIYERTMLIQNRFRGMDEEIDLQLPSSRTDHFELLFGNNQSLWQRIPEVNEKKELGIGDCITTNHKLQTFSEPETVLELKTV